MIAYTNQNIIRHCIFISITTLMILCFILMMPANSQAKSRKPEWKKEISSLQIGKSYRYRIKYCPKKATVHFASNHPSYASVNRKTGVIRAKKKGTVIITAKIKQAHCNTKKIKTKLRIVKKKSSTVLSVGQSNDKPNHNSILDHVQFTIADKINPWNHSVMLYSSRILLQSEVQNTTLTLSRLNNNSGETNTTNLTANFSSLSANGKTVTYQLNASSARKLCPGNGTQDGEYLIKSSIFQNSLSTHYQERIQKNTICGFAIDTNKTSLSHVSVQLYSDTQDKPLAATTTDQNGYYQFQDITENNITLRAQLDNYDIFTISSLHPTNENICQNIIMHPSSTKDLTVSCQILNKQEQPITDATVILTTDNLASPSLAIQGTVDQNGLITFANHSSVQAQGYTQINYQNMKSSPEYFNTEMPRSDTSCIHCDTPMTRNQDYNLYIFPGTEGSSIPKDYRMVSVSFSFMPLLSDHLFLQLHLQELPILTADKITIHTDTLPNPVSRFDYTLYDKQGNTIYHTSLSPLSQESISDYSSQLSNALQKDCLRLYDGKYYAAITAYSSDGQNISATSIISVDIHNSIIRASNFTISPYKTFHTLIFADTDHDNLEKMSFILYQKMDSIYLPIGTYTSDPFTSIYSNKKSYLDIPVLPDVSYCLVPVDNDYIISSGTSFHIPKVSDNPASSAPDHQIIITDSAHDNSLTKDSPIKSHLSDYLSLCTEYHSIDAAYFSTALTYPNTIYAYYQPDGTFQNFLFTTPAFFTFDHTTSLICNRMQNGTSLSTSQLSYCTTPFFVT